MYKRYLQEISTKFQNIICILRFLLTCYSYEELVNEWPNFDSKNSGVCFRKGK